MQARGLLIIYLLSICFVICISWNTFSIESKTAGWNINCSFCITIKQQFKYLGPGSKRCRKEEFNRSLYTSTWHMIPFDRQKNSQMPSSRSDLWIWKYTWYVVNKIFQNSYARIFVSTYMILLSHFDIGYNVHQWLFQNHHFQTGTFYKNGLDLFWILWTSFFQVMTSWVMI